MSDDRGSRIEEKIVRIEKEVEQISDIKLAVGRIETKLDERSKAVNQRLEAQDKRLSRFGLKFWGILVLFVGGLVKLAI